MIRYKKSPPGVMGGLPNNKTTLDMKANNVLGDNPYKYLGGALIQ